MSNVYVRKARAGVDSAGHDWAEDGAVVPVPYQHALVLVAISDGGFTIVEALSEDTASEVSPDTPPVPAGSRARGGRREAAAS